jgi:hypothetical protein
MLAEITLFPIERHVGVEKLARRFMMREQTLKGQEALVKARAERMMRKAIAAGMPTDVALQQANDLCDALCSWLDFLKWDRDDEGEGAA